MLLTYLIALFGSLALALLLTPYVIRLAKRIGAIDNPSEAQRKHHKGIVPRAGGIVIAVVFVLMSFSLFPGIPTQAYWGALLASLIVFGLGLLDDIIRLNPWVKLVGQFVAAGIAIFGFGLGVDVISNPFGQQISLVNSVVQIASLQIPIFSVLFTLVWLVGMTNTINFLDGLDGLATGVSAIAAFILFLVSMSIKINQPATAVLALIVVGVCIGFLRYNFFPARIFLGDSGAYFLGMLLGCLAIISGAKLATALLVLGVPVMDAIWSVIRRIATGRSPFRADRGHFHYILVDSGLSQRRTVMLIYLLAFAFGAVSLLGDGRIKLIALGILAILVAVLMVIFTGLRRRRTAHEQAAKN